jgi:di/tricarboxylate transporter
MDFHTRFMITRWVIRGLGLLIWLGIVPSVGALAILAWRKLFQALRTKWAADPQPVPVTIITPAPAALKSGHLTARLTESAARTTPELAAAHQPRLASPANPPALPGPLG